MDPNATWQMLCEYLRALHENPDDEELRADVDAGALRPTAEIVSTFEIIEG